jgi:[acyl-carrier-protein] S-malonyltransferase
MGQELARAFPQARLLYEEADETLGYSLSALCFEGPAEVLNDTIHTQPAIFVTSLAVMRVLEAEGKLQPPAVTAPSMVAGHSLGELAALVAAGAMDPSAGLRLVRERGRLMKLAGERSPGGMAAVLKMDDADVERHAEKRLMRSAKRYRLPIITRPGRWSFPGTARHWPAPSSCSASGAGGGSSLSRSALRLTRR